MASADRKVVFPSTFVFLPPNEDFPNTSSVAERIEAIWTHGSPMLRAIFVGYIFTLNHKLPDDIRVSDQVEDEG